MRNLLMTLGLCLVVACGTLTCGEKAVGNAKAYLLSEMQNLTEAQRASIENAEPMVMEVTIQPTNTSSEIPAEALVQKCVVFNLDFLNKSLVVFGVCNKTTKDWDPIRGFLADKKYSEEDSLDVPVSDEELALIVEKMTPPIVEEPVVEEPATEEEGPTTSDEGVDAENVTITID